MYKIWWNHRSSLLSANIRYVLFCVFDCETQSTYSRVKYSQYMSFTSVKHRNKTCIRVRYRYPWYISENSSWNVCVTRNIEVFVIVVTFGWNLKYLLWWPNIQKFLRIRNRRIRMDWKMKWMIGSSYRIETSLKKEEDNIYAWVSRSSFFNLIISAIRIIEQMSSQ